MNATAETINDFGTPLTAEQMPARIAQPFDIGSTALPPVIEVHAYEGPGLAHASNAQQNCVHAGLTYEHVTATKLLRAGHQKQTTDIEASFDPMPPLCHGLYGRIAEIKAQIKVNNKWRDMNEWRDFIYSRDAGTSGDSVGLYITPTGHEGPWIYWRHGEKVRALFRNIVKNSHGKIVGEKEFKEPLQVEASS